MSQRLLICTNMPAPYRHSLFNRINISGVELTVLFYRKVTQQREWTVALDEARYKYSIMSNARHWTPKHMLPMLVEAWKHRRETIIVGGWGDPESYWAILCCLLLRARWGLWVGLHSVPDAQGWRGWIKRNLLSYAHMIVCYHSRTATVLRALVPKSTPVYVGWNVGDVEKAALLASRCDQLGGAGVSRRLAFVGALSERKGVDLLLRAVKEGRIKDGLDLIGKGPLWEKAKQLEATVPAGLLCVHGFIEGEELQQVLAKAVALILPTRRDPGAIVVSEALAAGLPVLLSDADGGVTDYTSRLPQYVQVFEANNYEAMCQSIDAFFSTWPYSSRRKVRSKFLSFDPMGVYANAFISAVRG